MLLDLSFFKQIDEFEKKLEEDENLQDLDDEIRDNHLETVTRFYLLFESILKYNKDLNRFVQDLEEGLYIQQTIETVFGPEEGKQLMVSNSKASNLDQLYWRDLSVRGFVPLRCHAADG